MVSPTIQKIAVVIIVLLALGFFGYKTLIVSPSGQIDVNSVTVQPIVGQDILTLVEQLKTVHINQKIFTSALFTNLTDFGVTIYPELQGRLNPFAVLGGVETVAPTNPAQTVRR